MLLNRAPADGRLHVLQVVGNAIVGGMETWVAQLAERLPRERFRLGALLPHEGALARRLRAAGVEVATVAMPEEPPWASVQAAAALCTAGRVDLLHAHLPRAHLLAALAGALARVPVLTTLHGCEPTPLDLAVHRLAKSHVSVVCRPSLHRALALGVDPALLSLEPNGVDTRAFAPSARTAGGLRARLGLAPSVPLAGFVGRLSPEKGPEVFVRAAAALRRRLPRVHAVIVGTGPEEAALRAQARALGLQGRLHFAGVEGDMPALVPELDVLLLTSHTEAMPLALMEALACGVPVVATQVGGVADLVAHGECGWLVEPGDADGAAEAAARLLADDALRRRFGERARERAVAEFDLAPAVARVAALLERVARPPRPAAGLNGHAHRHEPAHPGTGTGTGVARNGRHSSAQGDPR